MGEDLIGGLGPGERLAAVVPAVDEPADGGGELADRVEGAAADGLAGDDAEEDLDDRPRSARSCTSVSYLVSGIMTTETSLLFAAPSPPPGPAEIRTGVSP